MPSINFEPLGFFLAKRDVDVADLVAHRNSLHQNDKGVGATSIAQLARSRHDLVYERMQDGPVFGQDAHVLSFCAESSGRARLAGYRRLIARRAGVAPGDIIYDADVAHLLHDFIVRAENPIFYDAFEIGGLEDLVGRLVVQWPQPLSAACVRAGDSRLVVLEG